MLLKYVLVREASRAHERTGRTYPLKKNNRASMQRPRYIGLAHHDFELFGDTDTEGNRMEQDETPDSRIEPLDEITIPATPPPPSPLQPPERMVSSHNQSPETDLDPWTPSEPKSFDELFKSRSTILLWSGNDIDFLVRKKLHREFEWVPLRNPTIDLEVYTQENIGHRILVIYIESFFKDGRDFAMYVKDQKNMSALLAGTFTKKAYDGVCFATPVLIYDEEEIFTRAKCTQQDVVSRVETKGLRWKYLYHSACAAYGKLEFDEELYKQMLPTSEQWDDEMARVREAARKLPPLAQTTRRDSARDDDEEGEEDEREEEEQQQQAGLDDDQDVMDGSESSGEPMDEDDLCEDAESKAG